MRDRESERQRERELKDKIERDRQRDRESRCRRTKTEQRETNVRTEGKMLFSENGNGIPHLDGLPWPRAERRVSYDHVIRGHVIGRMRGKCHVMSGDQSRDTPQIVHGHSRGAAA